MIINGEILLLSTQMYFINVIDYLLSNYILQSFWRLFKLMTTISNKITLIAKSVSLKL